MGWYTIRLEKKAYSHAVKDRHHGTDPERSLGRERLAHHVDDAHGRGTNWESSRDGEEPVDGIEAQQHQPGRERLGR